eukprot:6180196-Pleurochrysis_carterae.AAC.2
MKQVQLKSLSTPRFGGKDHLTRIESLILWCSQELAHRIETTPNCVPDTPVSSLTCRRRSRDTRDRSNNARKDRAAARTTPALREGYRNGWAVYVPRNGGGGTP